MIAVRSRGFWFAPSYKAARFLHGPAMRRARLPTFPTGLGRALDVLVVALIFTALG